MATVNVEFGTAMGAGAPVAPGNPRTSQTITSSTTNQISTIAAKGGEYVSIVTTGNVYVQVGASPNATNAPRRLVTTSRDFGPLKEGDKVAIVDAV